MKLEAALSLMLISLGAFITPLLARQLRIPAPVVEMAYGVFLAGLGLRTEPLTSFLALLGFVFLMFLAGYEIDFERIEEEGRGGLIRAGVLVFLVGLMAYGATVFLGFGIYYSVVIFTVSVGLGVAILKEMGITQSPPGQAFLLIGSLGELATLVLLTVMSGGLESPLGMALRSLELVGIFAVAYFVLLVLRAVVWWNPEGIVRLAQAHDAAEIGIRAAMALAFSFVALVSLLGAEPILGSFIAGALFGFVFRDKEALEEKLSAIGYGFLIPVFFINVGIGFDLAVVVSPKAWQVLGLLAVASLVAKLLPLSLPLLRGVGFKDRVGLGLLAAAPLSLLVAIAEVGVRIGALGHHERDGIILLAMVLSLTTPPLARLMLRRK